MHFIPVFSNFRSVTVTICVHCYLSQFQPYLDSCTSLKHKITGMEEPIYIIWIQLSLESELLALVMMTADHYIAHVSLLLNSMSFSRVLYGTFVM